MDTISLQAFVSVAQSQSFSRAAEHLYVTQPAVSKRIFNLENQLDIRLFDRIGRDVLLTEAGKALYPRALRILQELEDSRKAIGNLSGRVGGKLSIGTSHHIGLHRLPEVLGRYSEAWPEVELDLHFLDSEAACLSVEKGKLELGIVTLPNVANEKLISVPVWEDPLVIVVSRQHPVVGELGSRTTGVLPEMIAKYPVILPGPKTFTSELVQSVFGRHGVYLNVKLSSNYLETIKMMVDIGLGWSVLPQKIVDEEKHLILDVKGISFKRILGIVQNRNRTLSNAAREMIVMLSQRD